MNVVHVIAGALGIDVAFCSPADALAWRRLPCHQPVCATLQSDIQLMTWEGCRQTHG